MHPYLSPHPDDLADAIRDAEGIVAAHLRSIGNGVAFDDEVIAEDGWDGLTFTLPRATVRVAPSGDAEAMAREVIEAIVNALAAALEVSHL